MSHENDSIVVGRTNYVVDWTPEPVEPWMDDALCAQTDPDMFFPEKGGSTKDAKTVCGKCEVREQCLAFALRHDESIGIWGGLSVQEREQLRREMKAAA